MRRAIEGKSPMELKNIPQGWSYFHIYDVV